MDVHFTDAMTRKNKAIILRTTTVSTPLPPINTTLSRASLCIRIPPPVNPQLIYLGATGGGPVDRRR